MLFYPANTFPVLRPNISSTYQEVERRIIHSDDYQEMGSKAEGTSLTHESRIQRKRYSKEDYHFFLPFVKKILLMIISQISFCLNTEKQSSLIPSLVATPFFLDQGITISGASVLFSCLVLTLF